MAARKSRNGGIGKHQHHLAKRHQIAGIRKQSASWRKYQHRRNQKKWRKSEAMAASSESNGSGVNKASWRRKIKRRKGINGNQKWRGGIIMWRRNGARRKRKLNGGNIGEKQHGGYRKMAAASSWRNGSVMASMARIIKASCHISGVA